MSDIENLSTAFKHINLYEILEPQKVHNVQVATLVDISDDKTKPNEELIGSFIDKVTKPKFDILDVYENIYVTPQHIATQKKDDLDFDIFIRESHDEVDSASGIACAKHEIERNKPLDTVFDNTNTTQISFPKLLRLDEKPITKHVTHDLFKPKLKLDQDVVKSSDSINELMRNIKQTNEQQTNSFDTCDFKLTQNVSSSEIYKDTNSFLFMPSDLRSSDDFLKPKLKLNKGPLDLPSDVYYPKLQEVSKKREDHTSLLPSKEIYNDLKTDLSFLHDAIKCDEFSQNKFHLNKKETAISPDNETPSFNVVKPTVESRDLLVKSFFDGLKDFREPQPQALKEQEKSTDNLTLLPNTKICLKSVNMSQNIVDKKDLTPKIYEINIKCSIIDDNRVVQLPTHPAIPMLQTVKLDKKMFAKRIIKTENEKLRYTKGPDLYEKSLILPQIMSRVMVRNKKEDVKKNVRRKFLLDYQNSKESDEVFEMPNLVTEVIMEDCNKERLKALKVRQAFDEFVKFGKI